MINIGVESFFVKLNINNFNNCNEEFIFDLLRKKYKVKKTKDHLVINKTIEIEIESHIDGKIQIILIACFSDYKNNIKLMNNIIDFISNSIEEEIKVSIWGEEFIYSNIQFCQVVEDRYKEKYNGFVEVYGDKQIIVTPTKFYKKI